ncbi:AAA family ATPase [Gemmata sp. JC717]|uniref:AAA family ATPase n=1 Tax=Gemmata algarum TaxID=2975278 RepID=UPI0021BA99B4|nr:AAA family ATPase [Gemmata algarum]MDY3552188.1 AAA family ATPase [Gemmata algarum]
MAVEIEFPVSLALRKLGPGAVLAEPLFFPELARLGANRALAGTAARRNLTELIPKLDPETLLRRRRSRAARELTFTLELSPPRTNEAWRDPLVLTFHAAVWDQSVSDSPSDPDAAPVGPGVPQFKGYTLARVLELGIEIIADPADNLVRLLQKDTLAALRRLNLSVNLKSVAGVQTTLGFAVESHALAVRIPTLKDRAIRAGTDQQDGKLTLLQQIATLLGRDDEKTYEADETVSELTRALTGNPTQSVLLIGPSGVGKTAAVRELARRWRGSARAPVFQTSGARVVAGQTGFGMWQERCQDLIKDATKRKAVIHFGPLVELLEVGKSEHNSSGLATFLRPAIGRGELLCVAECTPEQLPLIEKLDPQLLDAFRHITIEEPGAAKGRAILASFARDNARRVTEPAALAATDRLHRRYATYSAYPGRPLRFLENLIRDGARGAPITETEVYDAFTRETGLPRAVLDPSVPLDLAATHDWFARRVIGQPDAVGLVTDLLATVKAGLTRPNRPIASLLFIGPTGVGKTEMAKAVAEFLFGSKDRLTRFDMSEYADPVSVRRLVGGAFGGEGLLTAKVREQPFAVLLLDEVEKADHSFFDLLLQALGEARLTDASGRLADFRNTVVILTSNLGADSFRRGSSGFLTGAVGKTESQEHFARAVEQFLRPEMFNRLDRIVPFAPLGPEVIRGITDREWHKVQSRDGVRFRDLALATAPALLDHLAAVGYDPRYGARPLKRAMERELLAPLARQMNRHAGDVPLAVEVGVAGGAPTVAVRALQGARAKSAREPSGPSGKLAAGAQVMRRWHQVLAASSAVRELNNEVYQFAQQEVRILKRQAAKKKITAAEAEALAKLGRLRELADEVARQRDAAFALEDATVIAFHETAEPPAREIQERLDEANRDWDKLLLRLYALSAPEGDRVTLALFSEHRGHLAEVAAAYRAIAHEHGMTVRVFRYALPAPNDPPATPPERAPLGRAADPNAAKTVWVSDNYFFRDPEKLLFKRVAVAPAEHAPGTTAGTIGLVLEISGVGAHLRFWGETGRHEIKRPDDKSGDSPDVMVRTSSVPAREYLPPETVVRRGWFSDEQVRRQYDFGTNEMHDAVVERVWSNVYGSFDRWLAPALAANVRSTLLKMISE